MAQYPKAIALHRAVIAAVAFDGTVAARDEHNARCDDFVELVVADAVAAVAAGPAAGAGAAAPAWAQPLLASVAALLANQANTDVCVMRRQRGLPTPFEC
jgi:hypothetical protein